ALIGRDDVAQLVEPDRARRFVEVPRAHRALVPAAMHRREPAELGEAAPEMVELGARARGAALDVALRQHRGVDRAGAGAADALDAELPVLEQAVEHAPGEGAMRAATLQREIDGAQIRGFALGHARHSATAASAASRSSY